MFLTERQLAVLNFIRDFIRDRGISPTLDEMSQYFGVSKITIYEHVSALEKKGALRKTRNLARSIELVQAAPADAGRTLMVRGQIAAGAAIEAIENPEAFELSDLAPVGEDAYLLRVKGDSMINAHICDGDLVVVQPASSARDGEIIVALLPDETTGNLKATLKRFFREPDHIRLQPENDAMQPIRVRDVVVQGRVAGVVRPRV
ncbi:MAG: repressor LexA [Candidatus Sericytochromatia bacterium]|nr:repressor LexA [Candidatus Tanganyikabacteria bacterium]